jgi:pimeloyl-ACP methyl ester carboxylesterase
MRIERPDLFRGIIGHEPPLFSLLADDPRHAPMLESFSRTSAKVAERIASGDHAGAAEQFVEEVVGSGPWARFPPEIRRMVIEHAPTYLDEANDPDVVDFDLECFRGFPHPALLTRGDQSPPAFEAIITRLVEALPSARAGTLTGAGHAPQVSHPEVYVEALSTFARRRPQVADAS